MIDSLRIVCFHRVLKSTEEPGAWPYLLRGSAITAETFQHTVEELAATYDFVDENEATRILLGDAHPGRSCCWVTFDDGYLDSLTVAAPVLAEFGIRPTLFLTTGVLEQSWHLPVDHWYALLASAGVKRGRLEGFESPWEFDLSSAEDRERLVLGPEKRMFLEASPSHQGRLLEQLRHALGANPSAASGPRYLSQQDVRELSSSGWSIGPHGHRHRLLTHCSTEAIEGELTKCDAALKVLQVRKSRWFAYADGACNLPVVERVKACLSTSGYIGALTVEGGQAVATDSSWVVPREILS